MTCPRELYIIQGEIISDLYGENLQAEPVLTLSKMLEMTVTLEQKLMTWRQNLIPQLQRRPWEDVDPDNIGDPIFNRLSVIMTLRYLNTRILLHRPILSSFLRRKTRSLSDQPAPENNELFFLNLGDRSIQVCESSAMEMVNIIHKMSKPPSLLGAWWFSAYYSQFQPRSSPQLVC